EEKARAKAEQKAKAEAAPKKLRIPALKMPSFPTLQIGGRMAEKRIIALSIEGTDLRLVSFYKDSIESWDSVSFNPELFEMGRVADPEGMGEVIKSALEGREVSQSRVVCAPPGLRAISRVIGMPKIGTRELEIAVPLEGRRLMMVSEEENYLHWQAIPTETNQIQIFVLAVPKEPLLDFMKVLRVAGVKPHALDLKPLALMRAVNQKDAIIANGESNSMELVIGVDDVPVLIRSVFLGEEVVTPDYAVGRISDEIRRTIETYNESNTDNPLDPEVPIYLSGATAASVPFALNVAALTGRTVQPLEPPIHYPEDFPLAEFMVNVGLILKIL
ncbi:MAG: pilus assembly protein PilM, partial [Dehalococcoidia bacterium]|nr:pilus assembly protein PilM [Dehalococcoidia bacterium]